MLSIISLGAIPIMAAGAMTASATMAAGGLVGGAATMAAGGVMGTFRLAKDSVQALYNDHTFFCINSEYGGLFQ